MYTNQLSQDTSYFNLLKKTNTYVPSFIASYT